MPVYISFIQREKGYQIKNAARQCTVLGVTNEITKVRKQHQLDCRVCGPVGMTHDIQQLSSLPTLIKLKLVE